MAHTRKLIIAGNWKMHKTPGEARELVKDILLDLGKFNDCEVIVCPPYTALPAVSEMLTTTHHVRLGAQNVHEAGSGAFTGEISASMLRELFVKYVIIGHSERRQYYRETNELVRRKTQAALESGLKPIVCIGETLAERESDQWRQVLETQVREGFKDFGEKEMAEITVAYEPVWAIGTGRTATPEIAQETHGFVRSVFQNLSGPAVADKLRIQYGGSVKADNAQALMSQPDIDGALVGGASLDARSFVSIIKNACAP
jgi:triosephosphate isomerase (TIM)